jgi:hypothetical protein
MCRMATRCSRWLTWRRWAGCRPPGVVPAIREATRPASRAREAMAIRTATPRMIRRRVSETTSPVVVLWCLGLIVVLRPALRIHDWNGRGLLACSNVT